MFKTSYQWPPYFKDFLFVIPPSLSATLRELLLPLISLMRKPKVREVRRPVQGHTHQEIGQLANLLAFLLLCLCEVIQV